MGYFGFWSHFLQKKSKSFNSRAIHDGDDFPMLMSLHLSIASRILLKYSNLFNEFVNQLAVELTLTPDKVAGKVSRLNEG